MNYTFRAEVSKTSLDLQFYANYGQRNPSPIVEAIQDDYGEMLTSEELTTLAGVILEMYKEKWDKLGALYDIQYDPIHNYLDDWNDRTDEDRSEHSSGSTLSNTTYGQQETVGTMRSDSTHETRVVTEDNTRTRTDDLVKTERRNLSNSETRTDNLQQEITYGRTDTRTDNLLETDTFGKTDTRTDNLTEAMSYGKHDTRTDNLTEEITYGKTNLRTDNLKHEIKGTETTTPADGSTQSVYAFNSSSGLPTDSSINSGTVTLQYGSRENDDTGTQTDALSGKDTKTNTGTQASVLSGSDSKTNTGTETTVSSGSDTIANTGTQATAASGKDTTKDTGTRTTVNENTGTVTIEDDGTETTVDNKTQNLAGDTNYTRNINTVTGHSGTDSVAGTTSGNNTLAVDKVRSGRHFGNIGNLTSQKQILEEINLWKWNYVKDILADVKEFCTLPVYLNATEWQLVDPDED